MRVLILSLVLALAPIAAHAASSPQCGWDVFLDHPEAVGVATVVRSGPDGRAYFRELDETHPCLRANCPRQPFLVKGDEVITAPGPGGLVCVWFQPKGQKDFGTQGWFSRDALAMAQVNKTPRSSAWAGKWVRDRRFGVESSLTITPVLGERGLKVKGMVFHADDLAAYRRGALNDGGVDQVVGRKGQVAGTMAGMEPIKLTDPEEDCRAGFALIGEWLLVTDNDRCGGVNANLDGLYHREGRPKRAPR